MQPHAIAQSIGSRSLESLCVFDAGRSTAIGGRDQGWRPPVAPRPGEENLRDGRLRSSHRIYLHQVVRASEHKEIVFDSESRRRLQIGINKVADAVAVTLGPRGAAWVNRSTCMLFSML